MQEWQNNFTIKYVKEKKTNQYDDLLQAKNFFTDAVASIDKDEIVLINKYVQPEYYNTMKLLDTCISIWENALKEADFKNRKARIDQKVGRHIYYNLALAYLLKNDFDKAQQYLQGREDEETNEVMLKNTFAGMKNLSAFIDNQKQRYEANKWRPLIIKADEPYVYKDPATRMKEKEEKEKLELARQKAITDSLNKIKKTSVKSAKTPVKKPVVKKKP